MSAMSIMLMLFVFHAMNMHAEVFACTVVTMAFMCIYKQNIYIFLGWHLLRLMSSYTESLSAMPEKFDGYDFRQW